MTTGSHVHVGAALVQSRPSGKQVGSDDLHGFLVFNLVISLRDLSYSFSLKESRDSGIKMFCVLSEPQELETTYISNSMETTKRRRDEQLTGPLCRLF